MPSGNYRYYCLDGSGQLHGAEWFHAESDMDAIAQVEARHPDAKCEIWQDYRLVAKLGFQLNDVISQSQRTIANGYRTLQETAHLVHLPPCSANRGDAR
jgi:hypothetical protein